jgi:DnaK suppressor protein
MTAKRLSKKTATKKKTPKTKARKTAGKSGQSGQSGQPRPARTTKKKAKAAPAKKKAKAPARTAKTRRAKPAAPRKSAKAPGRRATKAKRKVAVKKARRRPPLDLRRFRHLLRDKQADLLQAYLNAKGDSRNRESDGTEDYIDYAVSSYDREFLLSLTELERSQLTLVEEALKRIERGEYGLCSQCERPIPVKRIEVQPWARYCVHCQELADSGLTDEDGEFPGEDDDLDAGDAAGEIDLDEEAGADDAPDEERLIGR